MRGAARVGVLAVALLASGCDRDKQIDRNKTVASIDLNQTVAHAKTQADREHPDAKARVAPPPPRAGYAWVGEWAKRGSLCPFRRWHLDRRQVRMPDGTTCGLRSVDGDAIGGDKLELACSNRGMKTDELWLVKFAALDQLRITRTIGGGVPAVVTLARCG